MTEQQAAGPPCDVCGDEPAVVSLMQLADYSTQQLGAACAAPFLRAVADMFDPPPPAPAPAAAPDGAEAAPQQSPEADPGDDTTPAAKPAQRRPAGRRKAGTP